MSVGSCSRLALRLTSLDMTRLVFMDTETTGLALDDHLWEFAAVVRDPGKPDVPYHFFLDHDMGKCQQLPESFRVDHQRRYDQERALGPLAACEAIMSIFGPDKPHVVGAVPNFDTERIGRLLAAHGLRAPWHYHLIDVENLAVGYLAAKGEQVSLPWDSDDLTRLLGLTPPTDERHTAMGDVHWARSIYDAVTS